MRTWHGSLTCWVWCQQLYWVELSGAHCPAQCVSQVSWLCCCCWGYPGGPHCWRHLEHKGIIVRQGAWGVLATGHNTGPPAVSNLPDTHHHTSHPLPVRSRLAATQSCQSLRHALPPTVTSMLLCVPDAGRASTRRSYDVTLFTDAVNMLILLQVRRQVDQVVTDQLGAWLDAHPAALSAIVNKALTAARAAEAARKARELVRRKSSLTSSTLPGKLADCTSKDK